MICKRCLVSGRVQGVFYRASTQRRAQELGLSGSARNLYDSRVEVFACGEEQDINTLEAWLWEGPPHADVTDVECATIPLQTFRGFETG